MEVFYYNAAAALYLPEVDGFSNDVRFGSHLD